MDERQQLQWLKQWTDARVALADQRRRELRALTPQRALAATEALLALGAAAPLDPARRTSSGLVQQQTLFHRRRSE